MDKRNMLATVIVRLRVSVAKGLPAAAVALLLLVAPSNAVTLTGNESLNDGVLSGTGGPVTNQADRTFWWADREGNAAMNPASAGLDLANFSLTRTDTNTVILNLNDGTSNGSIVAGSGQIQCTDAPGNIGHPILITNAMNISINKLNTFCTYGGGNISVYQSGSLTASNLDARANYAGYSAGAQVYVGGGSSSGDFQVAGGVFSSSLTYPGSIRISGYKSVSVGAGGLLANGAAQSSGGGSSGVTVTNIGSGGIVIAGTINAVRDGATGRDVVLATEGAVSVSSNIHTYCAGGFNMTPGGNIVITAASNIVVGGSMNAGCVYGGNAQYNNAGNIAITSTVGSVTVSDVISTNSCPSSGSYAGNAVISSRSNLTVLGSINLKQTGMPATTNLYGALSLAATGTSSMVVVSNLDCSLFTTNSGWTFSSAGGVSYIRGTLSNFMIRTTNSLRIPAGQLLIYAYSPGATNSCLGGSNYVMAGGGVLCSDRLTVQNGGASNVAATAVDLCAQIAGGPMTDGVVRIYYGKTDGGTGAGWDAFLTVSNFTANGFYRTNNITVESGTSYYYRAYASNSLAGESWAASSEMFVTTGVTVYAAVPSAAERGPGAGVFSIVRPAAFTNGDLTVHYTSGGTATPGIDYTALNGSATIPAGATNALITVTPVSDGDMFESDETVILTLAPGNCIAGSPSNATVTIVNDPNPLPWKAKITFAGYTRGVPLTNFPVLVVFAENQPTNFHYSQMGGINGWDLRFNNSNDTVSLNYEIESWTTNANSYVWVQVPLLTGTNDYIWAHWGSAGAALFPAVYTTNGATWSNGYAGVWHLNETSGVMGDSTGRGATGTVSGTVSRGQPGVVASCGDFNGSSGYVAMPAGTGSSLDLAGASKWTMSAWIKGDTTKNGCGVVSENYNWISGNNRIQAEIGMGLMGGSDFHIESGFFDGSWRDADTGVNCPLGQWLYLGGTWDGTTLRALTNGISVTSATPGGTVSAVPEAYYIGRRHDSTGSPYFDGCIDEVRISSVARSTNWIWAEYMNMASNTTFQIYGAASGAPSRLGTIFGFK